MRACLALFVLLVAASLWILGDGSSGWLYAFVYLGAVAPGFRIGFALFGRRHAAGWIAGALFGYTLANLALWAAIAAHRATWAWFVAAVALIGLLVWILLRPIRRPLISLPEWTRASTTSLLLVLLLTLAVAVPPLANVGWADKEGNRYYRAYFTADFVWHAALTAELKKFELPAQNPFLAGNEIHYYWTYFVVPAAIAGTGPAALQDIQRCLKLNALITGLLLMSTIFLATWVVVPRAGAAATAVGLALVASSAEGLAAIVGLWYTHQPMATLKNVNIDAVANWALGGYRIDGLQRSIWYVPQHSMAYALGLVAIVGVAAIGSRGSRIASLMMGLALAGSVLYSPLVGGLFALAYGASFVFDAVREPSPVRNVLGQFIVIAPVLAAIGWLVTNHMVEGAGGALAFGFTDQSLHHPVTALLVSLGPALWIAGAGCWPAPQFPLRRFFPYLALIVLALIAMYFVRLSMDLYWVGFRAGHLLLLVLPALAARFIATGLDQGRRRVVGVVVALTLMAGAPTLAIDEYNAQDIHNFSVSPGDFPFTIVISRDQQAVFAWIRTHTPKDAIVQMDPVPRGRWTWSLVPSWAERRMAAGLPISMMHTRAYDTQSQLADSMFAQTDAAAAWAIAKQLGVDYVYEDDVERKAGKGEEVFDKDPAKFEEVFRSGDVGVYRVK
ncbi:MAG: hypothetical protein EPO35_04275 [Acidobacteria bacterium]|nr:MAG: hypothetical protein EPO35_04275 [Acidobacteriota bacterium]